METPSSTRRVTRSQTLAALNNSATNNSIPISRKAEDSEKGLTKSRRNKKQQQDRSALIDITNDSPIVGLAMGSLETPSSATTKQRGSRAKIIISTPGSGEALLRGQVKTLLQKVEEEAELSKLLLENRPLRRVQGLVYSPMGLLAPTPANTPQIPNLSGDGGGDNSGLALGTPLPVVEETLKICQVAVNDAEQESLESQKSLTRSLLFDFSEKFETSDSSECSSVLTFEEARDQCSKDKSSPGDDDKASVWSIQANASTHDEEDEEEILEGLGDIEEYYHEECDDADDEDEDDGGMLDELCEGISKISVAEKTTIAEFAGKHTRFVYNSDDEIVEEEVCSGGSSSSPGVLRLKGLPTPKGKHLRFNVDEEEEEE
ncbi:hypothetical protein Tsubulata_023585 [Turnera subulata]|uniref:Chalcone-flavanone isomerase family protein n=1 Tax=Turnera subulata TaxID=218843 RepID=A0A9Q0G9B2_9ROSI|nr:hypothetical protein Tsubulata_023585 [Turnera subulata]